MGRTLEEIDRDIKKLFEERNKVLESFDRPFKEVYTVFNNQDGRIEDNTYVLNPKRKKDLKTLDYYVALLNEGSFKDNLEGWLSSYKENRCILDRVCEISETPVCCAHCSMVDDCMKRDRLWCKLVETGEVTCVKDCVIEG